MVELAALSWQHASLHPPPDLICIDVSLTAGNEESDVECLKKAGMSAVPADGCPAAQKAASYICKCNGGRGAIREFAEHIFLLMEKVNSAGKKQTRKPVGGHHSAAGES